MKCRDCKCAKRGYFKSVPDAYVCIGVKEPFVIENINEECRSYKEKQSQDTNDDGLYMELFAIKDGVRYNRKIINMKDVSIILSNGLMDGVEKLWV